MFWPAKERLSLRSSYITWKNTDENIDTHTAHTIVSWPIPKQWVLVQTSDLMMVIRQSIYILSIIAKEMGKLKTQEAGFFYLIWRIFFYFN